MKKTNYLVHFKHKVGEIFDLQKKNFVFTQEMSSKKNIWYIYISTIQENTFKYEL